MSYYADTGRNALVQGFLSAFPYVSLHTGNPGVTGANEDSGSGYARQPHLLVTPSAGQSSNPGLVHWPCANGPKLWVGFWSLLTGGVYGGACPSGDKPLRTLSVSAALSVFGSTNHGLANGTTLVLSDILGAGLPSGFVEGTVYYVVSSTTNTFQLAATNGGASITTSTDTEVFGQEIAPVPASGGTGIDGNIGKLILDGTLI